MSSARRENAVVALFRIPVFRRIWAAIAFSSLGDWLGLLANTALAQQLTREHSVAAQGAAISGVLLVRLAPDLLFGAVAAAIADKWDRRKTVIAGDLLAGVLYASIAVGYNLVWLYIAQFVIEAAGLFTQPAKQVIWVAIVPKPLLATANQISLLSVYGTVPIASGVFALLSATNRLFTGDETIGHSRVDVAIVIALVLNAVTFVVSASTVFLSRSRLPVVPRQREQEQGILGLLREGIGFVRQTGIIRALYVGIIGAFAAGGLTVGVAQLWVATLSAGSAGYSIMFGTVFTGLAVGMLIGPRVLPTFSRSRVFGLAIGSAGVTLLIASVIRDFVLADVLAGLVGLFAGMAWIIGYTLIGLEVEDRLRGRIFAFVLSSVRVMLLVTIAVGPVVAGFIGAHSLDVGNSTLHFSGPGLTLLVGGVLALLVAGYATSHAGGRRRRLRDVVRRQFMTLGFGHGRMLIRRGLFIAVEGVDATATAECAARISAMVRERGLVVTETAEPTESATGRRVAEVLADPTRVEPETAALLSAADRAEHVATVIVPALERGEVVVCDRFVASSLALHGATLGAEIERIRAVNTWGTGRVLADLTVAIVGEVTPADPAARQILLDESDVTCPPGAFPAELRARVDLLLARRRALRRASSSEAPR